MIKWLTKISDKNMVGLFWIFMIMQILDCLTTHFALSRGMNEANPIVNFIIKNSGFILFWIIKMYTALMIGYCISVLKLRNVMILSIIISTIPVINNVINLIVFWKYLI